MSLLIRPALALLAAVSGASAQTPAPPPVSMDDVVQVGIAAQFLCVCAQQSAFPLKHCEARIPFPVPPSAKVELSESQDRLRVSLPSGVSATAAYSRATGCTVR